MNSIAKLKFIHDGGASLRYHTVRTIKSQDIAAHSFGVAWLCEILTNGKASKDLIMAALAHDLAEHLTGDIPSPAKRRMKIGELFHDCEMKHLEDHDLAKYYDNLSEGELIVFKLADNIDGLLFCYNERALGNQHVTIIFERFMSYTLELIEQNKNVEATKAFSFDHELTIDILEYIATLWKDLK